MSTTSASGGKTTSGRVSMIPIEGMDPQTAKQTFEQQILPAVQGQLGFKGAQQLHSRMSNKSLALIQWEDQQSQERAEASSQYKQRLGNLQSAAGLTSNPQEDFEVVSEA